MEIILLKNVDNLGKVSDVVTVKNGYGRNYLIPQGMAVLANDKNRAKLESQLQALRAEEDALISKLKGYVDQLTDKVLNIGAKAGTSGKIFGSVTNVQIAEAIQKETGITIERRSIELTEEVKNLGSYTAVLNLHKEVQGKVSFEVVAD